MVEILASIVLQIICYFQFVTLNVNSCKLFSLASKQKHLDGALNNTRIHEYMFVLS